MAEGFEQSREVRVTFRKAMDEVERERRKQRRDGIRQVHTFAGKVFSPLINLVQFNDDLEQREKGYSGETRIAKTLKKMKAPWCYLNNVVFERGFGEYMQIDHIAVGPHGVFAIETKRWSGAFLGTRDVWRFRATGGKWKRVDSPTTQAVWHARAIAAHLGTFGFDVPVIPIVVFVEPDWVRTKECSCPVFTDAYAMRQHLLSQQAKDPLIPEECRQVARILAGSFALHKDKKKVEMEPAGPQDSVDDQAVGLLETRKTDPKTATEKQREYVARLIERAGLTLEESRLETLTKQEAQQVIDRLRFKRDVPLPDGLVCVTPSN